MKTTSLSLLTLGLLSASGLPCLAQATPSPSPATRKIRAASPVANQVTVAFSVSASIGASATGEAGAYLPSSASVSPQEKNYYVALNASLVVPSDMDESLLPTTIRLQARRFRNVTSPTGAVLRTYTGDTLDLAPLQLYISAPGPGQNYRSYFYSRYPPSPYNSVEEADAARVANDWNVSQVKGRWELRVHPDDGPSNAVDVKIDKRGQIFNLAKSYADYEQYALAGSAAYNACDGFVNNYIYGPLGLTGIGLDFSSGVTDDGEGALRFFQNKSGYALETPPFTGAYHVAIQGASRIFGRQQVDNNWGNTGVGPTVREFDFGTGIPSSPTAFYWNNAVSKAPAGSTPGLSILQELDGQ